MYRGYSVLAAVAMTAAVMSAPAVAAGTKIVNHSGVPIDELSVSPAGANQWGANLLKGAKEGSLDSGKSYVVKVLADGTYDFQIAAPDEAVFCVMPNVTVKKGLADLTPEMGKTCK